MNTYNEWYYMMLLESMKQKDKEINDAQYKQVELELPLPAEYPPGVEDAEEKDEPPRGVIIFNM